MTSEAGVIRGLVGVYHADGGVRGELAYLIGKVRGTAECALCDVTHHALGRKREWRALMAELGVPFHLVHRNERTDEVRAADDGRTPVVLARTDDGLVPLLGPAELVALDGSVSRFAEELRAAAGRAGLVWPPTE